jgi:multidrug efflux pump subunit AcrB
LCAVVGVIVTRSDINIFTQIGFLVLVGLACKNAILIVEFANKLQLQGFDKVAAVAQAARTRLRPILMTTFTTLLGLLPLALAEDAQVSVGGAGFGLAWYPLARTVIGGLAFSAAVSLFLVPALYVSLDKFIAWRARVRDSARARAAPRVAG